MALRLVLEVNIWVTRFLARAAGRPGSSCVALTNCVLEGYCRLGAVKAVVSPVMLDTLEYVLEVDCGFAPDLVAAARIVAEGSAAWLAVVGGLVQPMRDREDGGVLDVAIAGGAHLLVTANMADFTPGPRAAIDAEVVRKRGGHEIVK